MTDDNIAPGTTMTIAAVAPDFDAALDIETLAADLFHKVAAAQLDLLRARTANDRRAADTYLLCLRATALLLACLPTDPGGNAYRLKVLAAVTLREEDGAEASHAWQMAETALVLDQHRQTLP